ncbi:hypothetical protein TSMEX_003775 [Taenia solium]|eukprot:TsM_000355800 transcript=TsM_000355800 gene=TsM_000355800
MRKGERCIILDIKGDAQMNAKVLQYWTSRDDGCKLKTVGKLQAMTEHGIGSWRLSRINSLLLQYQKNGRSSYPLLFISIPTILLTRPLSQLTVVLGPHLNV